MHRAEAAATRSASAGARCFFWTERPAATALQLTLEHKAAAVLGEQAGVILI